MSAPKITTTDDAMLAEWWAQAPKKRGPTRPMIAEIPAYAATITITCRACGQHDTTAADWPGLVCRRCRADLDGVEARLKAAEAETIAAGERDTDAWLEYQAGLDDALADRWTALVQARTTAKARLDRALTGKQRSGTQDAAILAAIDEARVAWNEMSAKLARTAANTANPLATLLNAEASYIEAMRLHTARVQAIQIGLAEIDAARGERPL